MIPASLFQPRIAFVVTLLAAIGALGTALIAQFVFGLKPCILCLWQRLPYALLIVGALAALLITARAPKPEKIFLALFLLLFVASACVAFFHFGVEQHWWSLEKGCKVGELTAKTETEQLAELMSTPLAECDKLGWKIFGLSITLWNTAFSLGMAAYTALVLMRAKKA